MAGPSVTSDVKRHLAALTQRSQAGEIDKDAVTAIVEQVMTSLSGDVSLVDVKLYRELESLARFIQKARDEIAAIHPGEISNTDIPLATDELDAVVGATEDATGRILDTAEQMEKLAQELTPEQADRVTEMVTTIYEACNFQDITGQRITKVVKTLKQIETRVGAMLDVFGNEIAAHHKPAPVAASLAAAGAEPGKPKSDEDLLHGPQLPEDAKKQAEIDAILASFG